MQVVLPAPAENVPAGHVWQSPGETTPMIDPSIERGKAQVSDCVLDVCFFGFTQQQCQKLGTAAGRKAMLRKTFWRAITRLSNKQEEERDQSGWESRTELARTAEGRRASGAWRAGLGAWSDHTRYMSEGKRERAKREGTRASERRNGSEKRGRKWLAKRAGNTIAHL